MLNRSSLLPFQFLRGAMGRSHCQLVVAMTSQCTCPALAIGQASVGVIPTCLMSSNLIVLGFTQAYNFTHISQILLIELLLLSEVPACSQIAAAAQQPQAQALPISHCTRQKTPCAASGQLVPLRTPASYECEIKGLWVVSSADANSFRQHLGVTRCLIDL
eukprot:SAG31_NODE_1637_length_7679_cov_5.133509_6_plen_161_part_00